LVRAATTTVEAPSREKAKSDRTKSTRTNPFQNDDNEHHHDDDDDSGDDLEYLVDARSSREMDDPFHILLLGSTFDKPKITIPYVSSSLVYVLSMPLTEAVELSQFAHDEGMSCLGTWTREECLSLGKQLQVRDIVCRVVPYTDGGQRGWQAKDVNTNHNKDAVTTTKKSG
jgi:ATP-dependent Clp protease adapter protein ClpS